jgi:hypothetical protein
MAAMTDNWTTDDWQKLTGCPICEGDLQATEVVTRWLSGSTICVRKDARFSTGYDYSMAYNGYPEDEQTEEFTVYCENDHSLEQMLTHLNSMSKED